MKRLPLVTLFLLGTAFAREHRKPTITQFSGWGSLTDGTQKLEFFVEFAKNFFATRPDATLLRECGQKNLTDEQAVAMIDKLFKEHPEMWSLSFADGMISALTVRDGPCAGSAPSKAAN